MKLHIEAATDISLPSCVSLKIPSLPFETPLKLRKVLHDFLHHLPIPLPYCHYLTSVTQISFVRPQSVSHPISQRRIKASLSEAHCLGNEPCDCATLACNIGIPLTNGHIVACALWILHQIFGKYAPILLQNLNHKVAPSWNEVHTLAIESLRKLLSKVLPKDLDLDISAPLLYSNVLSELKALRKAAIITTPWYLRAGPIKAFKASSRRWLFLPCDKNMGRVMVICPSLFYSSVHTLYANPKQFVVLHEYPDLRTAHQEALDHLWNLVVKYDLAEHWHSGAKKSAPVSFCLPKNKSDEFHNLLKWRILFSHYRHPLRWGGRLIGRCLTLLVNSCPQYLSSLEMPHAKNLLSAVC